ncbi:unnamed protein product [Linum trigynum]|uniref:S-protein homolog n=1 Tax=Linum trigynum TaxID=586398 RepID=A0AAV2GYJ0_9ROSI
MFGGVDSRCQQVKQQEKAVIVHCQSADDDLHAHAVVADSSYGWDFQTCFGAGTVFWCRLAFQDKRLGFTAFNIGDDYDRFVSDYDVYDDGVFGTSQPWYWATTSHC